MRRHYLQQLFLRVSPLPGPINTIQENHNIHVGRRLVRDRHTQYSSQDLPTIGMYTKEMATTATLRTAGQADTRVPGLDFNCPHSGRWSEPLRLTLGSGHGCCGGRSCRESHSRRGSRSGSRSRDKSPIVGVKLRAGVSVTVAGDAIVALLVVIAFCKRIDFNPVSRLERRTSTREQNILIRTKLHQCKSSHGIYCGNHWQNSWFEFWGDSPIGPLHKQQVGTGILLFCPKKVKMKKVNSYQWSDV